jgi:peptidyl-prolyl cis-trans isomerase C
MPGKFLAIVLLLMPLASLAAEAPALSVNGQAVSRPAWQFLLLTRGVGPDAPAAVQLKLQDQAIERELVRQFLTQRNLQAPEALLEIRVHELAARIERGETTPEKLYEKLGLTTDQVRKELALAAAWETYIEQVVTTGELRKTFEAHRAELDGTRVQVRQIFRAARTPAEFSAATLLLNQVRQRLDARQTTFAAAAREFSEAPSKSTGGDVGWITGLGQLPPEVSRLALNLEPEKTGGPVSSRFGVHLVEVTAREPGQLSLEDVRPQLLEEISRERWQQLVQELRQTAKIERPASSSEPTGR